MNFLYIDVHTHVNLDAFESDFLAVTATTLQKGVAHINVGTGKMTSLRAAEIAALAPQGVFATVGLHPVRAGGSHDNDGSEPELFDRAYYEELAQDPKVVAIGECGLDYFRVDKDTKTKQEQAFIEQIELANDCGKPLMLHIRDVKDNMGAYEDALAILKAHAKVRGNVHFFAGTYDIAKQFWELGYTTSFTGVITFADQYDEIIKRAPLDMLHAETDAPYVSPVPYRGQRNEPLYVREVYKRIAELREVDEESVRMQFLLNAETMFKVELRPSLAS
jgi:TatD DNase family protein